MLVSLLIRWAVLAVAFAITAWLLSGMDVSGGAWGYIWVSALFGIVNALIGTILRILTLPLTVVTLGLFAIVVNALMLELTDALTDNLTIDEFFWTAIWAAIILAVVAMLLDYAVRTLMAPATAKALASGPAQRGADRPGCGPELGAHDLADRRHPHPRRDCAPQRAEERLADPGDAAAEHDPFRRQREDGVRNGDRERIGDPLPARAAPSQPLDAVDGFDAAAVAAAADRRVRRRVDRLVPELAGLTVEPFVQPATDDDSAADSRAERVAGDRVVAAAGAERRLGEREGAGVVDQVDRDAERLGHGAGDERLRPRSRRGWS